MLELLEHPGKSLRSYADILLVEAGLLVNDARFAVSYLDDVDIRKDPSLGINVSQEFDRGTGFHALHPHGLEILPPTYPRREKGPRRPHRSHR